MSEEKNIDATNSVIIKRFPFDVVFEFIEDPQFIEAFLQMKTKLALCPMREDE